MSRSTPSPIADTLIGWFAHAARPLPWRAADVSPWAVLVSEFMLQQTQVDRVVPQVGGVDRAVADARRRSPRSRPPEAVRAWDRLGYPRRALWLHRAATEIVERHGGEVPRDLDALLALQGIGPYTARAVAAFAFGHAASGRRHEHATRDRPRRRGAGRARSAVDGPRPRRDGGAAARSTRRRRAS